MDITNSDASILRPVKRKFFFSLRLYTTHMIVSKIFLFFPPLHYSSQKKKPLLSIKIQGARCICPHLHSSIDAHAASSISNSEILGLNSTWGMTLYPRFCGVLLVYEEILRLADPPPKEFANLCIVLMAIQLYLNCNRSYSVIVRSSECILRLELRCIPKYTELLRYTSNAHVWIKNVIKYTIICCLWWLPINTSTCSAW